MANYRKGANAERELIRHLWEKGFAAVRAAGSGVSQLPSPDLVALGNGRTLAFECKAWGAAYLNLSHEQFDSTLEWAHRAQAEFVIAWRVPKKGWFFLKPDDFKKNPKHYAITLENARRCARPLDAVLGLQTTLLQRVDKGGRK